MLDQPVVAEPPPRPPPSSSGLTSAEAERRRSAGRGNDVDEPTARSLGSIVRANTLTRFNAIIAALCSVVLVFGDPIDAVFGVVMVLNSVIGIVQEVRAKRSLDAVRVLIIPRVIVVRDGVDRELRPADLVEGDLFRLSAGDQIPVDGELTASKGLEVDESALTGESEPVAKALGDEVLSGSVAVAGVATVVATRVGAESWAYRLTEEAKDFVLTRSELRVGVDRLLAVVGWLLPPLSALLVWSQLRTEADLAEALVAAVAGVVALVPQGLVLLVSLTFAIAVMRLARNAVVVQELPSVEGLARVDVLCVDKTGTLTTGRLAVDLIEATPTANPETDGGAGTEGELMAGLAALSLLEAARTATMDALRPVVERAVAGEPSPAWVATDTVAFSSVRKWSGATFYGHGTWLLGAPEILLDAIAEGGEGSQGALEGSNVAARVDDLTSQSRRVLLVAYSPHGFRSDEQPPRSLWPVGLVALKEEVRSDAAETLAYFHRQNVAVKVVSGDNPRTVAAVAAELGVVGAGDYVDLRNHESLDEVEPSVAVFGRVLPEQKRDLVRLLQRQGHTVAMTGDGVNDIPSLKAADIGIAMNTATPATKAIAQLVLLDGRFDRLPTVVAEGRRVIANMERVSSLFVTKTVYAAVLAVAVGVLGVAFPFLPRHLSLIGALTIGIPAFVLSFMPSNEPCQPGYLRRVLRFSVPAGVVMASVTLAAYGVARSSLIDADLTQARTAATVAITLTGLWVLYRLSRPLTRVTAALLAVLALALAISVAPSPLSTFYALSLPPLDQSALLVAALAGIVVGLEVLLGLVGFRGRDEGPYAGDGDRVTVVEESAGRKEAT